MAFALLCTVSCVSAPSANAQLASPPLKLRQLDHTRWSAREGAPTDIVALAQTADGFLWIGASSGLYRFDGVRFERFDSNSGRALQSDNVSALHALSDGSLWIGYRFGGASRLAEGRVAQFGISEGLPSATVWDFAQDSSGVMWAATRAGLFRLAAEGWRGVGREDGLQDSDALALLADRRGTLWVATRAGTYAMPKGSRTFERRANPPGDVVAGSLREASNGAVWSASMTNGLALLADTVGATPENGGVARVGTARPARTMYVDRAGVIWLASIDRLRRYVITTAQDGSPRIAAETMDDARLAENTAAFAFLQDREDNVWVGTAQGLERYRPTKLTRLLMPQAILGPAIVAADSGGLWMGTANGATYRIGDTIARDDAAPRFVSAAHRDQQGTFWLGGDPGLWQHRNGVFDRITLPVEWARNPIQAVAHDVDERLWVSAVGAGVFCREKNRWTLFGNGLGVERTPAITIVSDSAGRVWLGYTQNRLVLVGRDGPASRVFTEQHGLDVGNVMAVHIAGDHVWVGGGRGLAYLRGEQFQSLRVSGADAPRGISGIVEVAGGELWLNAANGVTRIPAGEISRALTDTLHQVLAERFDFRDGIDGTAPQIRPLPSAVLGTDGRAWFATSSHVFWIDPHNVRRNRVPPPVHIRALEAGGIAYAMAGSIALPARTTAVNVRYTAASLAIPDRVRFRYRLEGSDTTWQDAGNRREAIYTNLGPGTYHFRVIAANEDGVWNEDGAAVEFSIAPTFMQTPLFVMLCGVAVGGIVWLLVQLRHRRATDAIRARFDATLAERTRIAGELHDTLLQDFSGVTMQLHAVQRLFESRPADAARTLREAIETADGSLRDARHAVWELRSPELESLDLPDALVAAARTVLASTRIELTVDVRGARRRLSPAAEGAAFRIGKEAIANAAKHSAAQTVTLSFHYEATRFMLCISDDGNGFLPAESERHVRRGHWGLTVMRERAQRVGGSLEIDASPGGGTRITLELPLS